MEDKKPKKILSSKVSIVGLFAMLTFILTVPLALMLSQQQQTFQQHAAEPTAVPAIPTVIIHNQTPGYIAGYIYKDTNQNGQRDAGEQPFPSINVKVTIVDKNTLTPAPGQAALATTVATDENGYFTLPLKNSGNDLHSYLLQVILPNGYKTIDTNPLLLPDLGSDTQKTVEVGLFTLKPLSVTPSVTCSPRPAQCTAGKVCPFLEPKGGWCSITTTTVPLPTQTNTPSKSVK
jgi:hypothetical protein